MGVTEPAATFSACFGAPFLVWHPGKYAELLAAKIKEHKVNVWLINTGWSGGSYGTGSRIKLRFTRAIIDAIHTGALANAPTQPDPVIGVHVVTQVPNVPAEMLIPERTWSDKEAFAATSRKLAGLFIGNFKKYESGSATGVKTAGPKV
jgi:phosphoenolpyruvate carboxykinase (ATP)